MLESPQLQRLRGADGRLNVNVRGEYFDDLKVGAVKPKVALSWQPVDALTFRGDAQCGLRRRLRAGASPDRQDDGRRPVAVILGIPWGGLAHGGTLAEPT